MIKYVVIEDYKDNFIGVVGHDVQQAKLFYKVRNKFVDQLLANLFRAKYYRTIEEDQIEYQEQITRNDSDYLDYALDKFELYRIVDKQETSGNLNEIVKENFNLFSIKK